jgi:hypothetical protein
VTDPAASPAGGVDSSSSVAGEDGPGAAWVVGSGADVVTAAGGDEGEPSLFLFRKLPATPALELEMEDCGCPSRGCLGKVHRQDSGLGGKAPHTHTGGF